MTAKRDKKKRRDIRKKPMLFSAANYKLMTLGVLLVVVGFTAMYLENEIYGIISLYISPIMILGGYITVIAAILKRDEPSSKHQPST